MSSGESSDEELVSRRGFLWRAGAVVGKVTIVGAIGAGVPVLAERVYHNWTDPDEALEKEKAAAEALAQRVKEGMATDWKQVSVWPGLAIIPHSVDLYKTPSLHPKSRLEWPDATKHLIVQRPFMIKESAKLNSDLSFQRIDNIDQVGDEVMGFWLPNSEDVAFCDRWPNRHSILLPNHSRAPIYKPNSGGIAGEPVSLEYATHRNGLTWRYLVADYTLHGAYRDIPADTVQISKVCGRSDWGDEHTTTIAYNDFQTGTTNADFIRLPGA